MVMSQTTILSRSEVETMGPPVPEELADLGTGEAFLCDLALKHVAMLPEPTTSAVAERMRLPRSLTEEILQKLYREKLIEVRLQTTVGATRYNMLDHGWDRLVRLHEYLRLQRRRACFPDRLHPHDAIAVDSFTSRVDGNGSSSISRSDSA